MTDQPGQPQHDGIDVTVWPGRHRSAQEQLAGLLAAYHLQTEAEKGEAVADAAALPERYRAEVLDPRNAFAGDVVLVASDGDTLVGCAVVSAQEPGYAEVKRLWVDPALRGRGVASALVRVALEHAGRTGVRTVRLSVWEWRTNAVALYERLGFTVTDSWDRRDRLVCMEHTA